MSKKQEIVEPAEPVIRRRGRLSSIWIIPIIAACIGGWLYYRSVVEAGTPITIYFDNGAGIQPGKTAIRYEGVEVGRVDRLEVSEDYQQVVVYATLEKSAAEMAREDTQLWLVKPRVSVEGVSGLDTLLSGVYISIRPGEGKEEDVFRALEEPPKRNPNEPGLHLKLTAARLGSAIPGTGVYYRNIRGW